MISLLRCKDTGFERYNEVCMPRLQQEPLSSCVFVTYASIKVTSHSGPEIQWLSRTDLIGIMLQFFLPLLFPFGIPCTKSH